MPWLELRIQSSRAQAAQLEDALTEAGALSVTFQDSADEPIFEPGLGETPLWERTRVTGLFDDDVDKNAIEEQLELPTQAAWQWCLLEDRDWEREWMQSYQPIQCGAKLWICPSWCPPPDPEAVNLLLDPGLAFGTGTHPTTFLCLNWLAEQHLEGKQVIDYGCGSGILGVAAVLLGAERAQGCDIDPQALLASRANAERNGLAAGQFPVYLAAQMPAEPADCVLANILAGPLVELAPRLLSLLKPGGLLCLSGILQTQVDEVIAAYRERIAFAPPQVKAEWALLSGRLVG